VWLTAVPEERVNQIVDVTQTIDRKSAALKERVSQTAHICTTASAGSVCGTPGGSGGRVWRTVYSPKPFRLSSWDERSPPYAERLPRPFGWVG